MTDEQLATEITARCVEPDVVHDRMSFGPTVPPALRAATAVWAKREVEASLDERNSPATRAQAAHNARVLTQALARCADSEAHLLTAAELVKAGARVFPSVLLTHEHSSLAVRRLLRPPV